MIINIPAHSTTSASQRDGREDEPVKCMQSLPLPVDGSVSTVADRLIVDDHLRDELHHTGRHVDRHASVIWMSQIFRSWRWLDSDGACARGRTYDALDTRRRRTGGSHCTGADKRKPTRRLSALTNACRSPAGKTDRTSL